MSRSSKDLRDLASLYALDALDPAQTAEFEAFLATSPEAQLEVEEFRAAAANLAGAESVAPPPSLRDAVMAEVDVTRQERPVVMTLTRRRVMPSLAAAAAVVMILAIGLLLVGRSGDETNEIAAVLESADAVTVQLDGPETPNLRVVWSAELGQAAVVPGETPVLDDETYVLWNLSGADARSVVAFDATETVLVDTAGLFSEPEAFAVSIEADPDASSPTEPIVAGPAPVET